MRKFGKIMAFVAGVSTMGLGQAATAAEGDTIRLALQPAPLIGYIVRDKELLEKRGFKTEWTVFPFSPPILEGMAAGSIDIALLGIGPMLSVSQQGANIKYFYDELANAAGMIVRNDSGITGPQELVGRKVAFPGKSSQLYAQLKMYLAGTGVSDTDIDLIRVNAADMPTLFDRGEVEAALAWPPYTSEPIRQGTATALFTADDLGIQKAGHWPNSGWGVRGEYAEEHEDAVLAVVEALHEATRFMRENPQEAYEIFAEATGYSVEAISFMIENGYVAHYDPEDSAPSLDSMMEVFNALLEYEIVRDMGNAAADIANAIEPKYVEKVLTNQ